MENTQILLCIDLRNVDDPFFIIIIFILLNFNTVSLLDFSIGPKISKKKKKTKKTGKIHDG